MIYIIIAKKYLPAELIQVKNLCQVSFPINEETYKSICICKEELTFNICENKINGDETNGDDGSYGSVGSDVDETNGDDGSEVDELDETNGDDGSDGIDKSDGIYKKTLHIVGILVEGKFHQYAKLNSFLSNPMNLPKDYSVRTLSSYCTSRMIGDVYEHTQCICDMDNPETYLTEDNGGSAYKVEIIENIVKIYTYPMNILIPDHIPCVSCVMSELLIQYEPEKIFIEKSMLNSMTEYSGGYGDCWDGNSILLFMEMHENKYKYISIGSQIDTFCIEEEIIEFHSPVGNNCVPYQFCLTKNYIYDFCFGLYNRSDIHDNGIEGIDYDVDKLSELDNIESRVISGKKNLFPRAIDSHLNAMSVYSITTQIPAGTKFRNIPNTC